MCEDLDLRYASALARLSIAIDLTHTQRYGCRLSACAIVARKATSAIHNRRATGRGQTQTSVCMVVAPRCAPRRRRRVAADTAAPRLCSPATMISASHQTRGAPARSLFRRPTIPHAPHPPSATRRRFLSCGHAPRPGRNAPGRATRSCKRAATRCWPLECAPATTPTSSGGCGKPPEGRRQGVFFKTTSPEARLGRAVGGLSTPPVAHTPTVEV